MNTTDQLRQQRRLRELNASTTRALTADPKVHIRQQQFYQGNHVLNYGPHLRLQEVEEADSLRGVADSLSLRLNYSDKQLHQKHRPELPIARLIFDWLETLRCESLVPDNLPGVKHNLQQRFYHWSAGFHHAAQSQTEIGILLYTTAQMCWSRLLALPVYPETEDFIESTRAALSASLGADLAGLRRFKSSQADYIPYALSIADFIAASVAHAHQNHGKQTIDDKEDTEEEHFALFLDMDDFDESEQEPTHESNTSRILSDGVSHDYQVFMRDFDTTTYVAEGIRPELLEQYRELINQRRQHQQISFHLLIQRLRKVLLTPTATQWEWDREEGLIDGRRLSQLISSPTERRLFKEMLPQWRNECSVSFLIDCSGSMKHHAETLTLMIDILIEALEKTGTKTEVLGFSTNAWNGGRPYRRWQATGRKANPGRLNEIDFRIFKDATTNWQQANRSIMALLKQDLYREGVDGEAVIWAVQRLLEQDSKRKVLYVISDGEPMDSATALANHDKYLVHHLQHVLAQQQHLGIEIWGIGIGLDLGHLYRNCLIADLEKGLDNHFIDDFVQSLNPFRRAY
ncbi:VWA domain-containing protein [Oligella sp. HMSC09E12]|uniref:cobaltochelatase CobT-related protein n=1 Tax=Oligella sp. HMSC09E12 TaxID=1581147 RepID=UPI0008A434CC|nr:VWA domain-containing protein [Oligella sp. HMSC09E12]OFV47437.1 hypothetical protein HMPREF3179_08390 [Oligella sp. HMSC09E12]